MTKEQMERIREMLRGLAFDGDSHYTLLEFLSANSVDIESFESAAQFGSIGLDLLKNSYSDKPYQATTFYAWLAQKTDTNPKTAERWATKHGIPRKYSRRVWGIPEHVWSELLESCTPIQRGNSSRQSEPLSLRHLTEIGETMPGLEQLAPSAQRHLLTRAAETQTHGAFAGYFLVRGRQVVAANWEAYEDISAKKLRTNYNIVNNNDLLSSCETVKPNAEPIEREFGDLRVYSLAFANTMMTTTWVSQQSMLVSLTHPIDAYIYGMAYNAKAEALKEVDETIEEYSSNEIERLQRRNAFARNPKQLQPHAPSRLLNASIVEAEEIFNSAIVCDTSASGISAAMLFKRDEQQIMCLHSASQAISMREENSVSLSPRFSIFESEAFVDIMQSMRDTSIYIKGADTITKITGDLRSFWLTLDDIVVGISPISEGRGASENLGFLVVLCCHADSSGSEELPFNFQFANATIGKIAVQAELLR